MKLRPYSLGLLAIIVALAALQACGGGGGAPPVEVAQGGLVVDLSSEQENRKAKLRAAATLYFSAESVADPIVLAKVSGPEGKAACLSGLYELPTVEEMQQDQNFAKEEASSSIIEQFQASGMPTPTRVVFTEWVTQG